MPKLGTNQSKQFSSKSKSLYVRSRKTLDFTKCVVKDFPTNKKDFQEIINTLQSFESDEKLYTRNNHKLDKKNKGSNSERISNFINTYDKVYSLDVYHRNGSKGNIRLLYTTDFDNVNLIYILDCFIDTH